MQHFDRVLGMFIQHSDRFLSILMVLCITILIILLIRFLVLWYFRVNDALKFLEWQKNLLMQHFSQHAEIIRLLKKVAGESETDARKTGAGEAQVADTERKAPAERVEVIVVEQQPQPQPQEQAPQRYAQASSPQESLQALRQALQQQPQQPTPQQKVADESETGASESETDESETGMGEAKIADTAQQADAAMAEISVAEQQAPQPQSQWETKTCPYCRKPNAPMSPYCCHCFEKLA